MRYFFASLLALALGAHVFAGDPSAMGRVLFQNLCAQCHGAKGEGNLLVKSPSIAGLPEWYLQAQIENFLAGRRGFHPQDPDGQIMRTISQVLNPGQTKQVIEYVSHLPRQMPEATIKADVTAGRELYAARCMECHRFNGEGELAFGAAPLVGLQDWYLASQLKKYQTGMRGVLKEDVNGQKMAVSASFIEDEATLKSVVAYLRTFSKELRKNEAEFGK
ncbi:MAG: c-type cytochrome [Verrucomicrobia bacterium]|nr:c-type cytochrome [Verrucomicrobiota bacterium]